MSSSITILLYNDLTSLKIFIDILSQWHACPTKLKEEGNSGLPMLAVALLIGKGLLLMIGPTGKIAHHFIRSSPSWLCTLLH